MKTLLGLLVTIVLLAVVMVMMDGGFQGRSL